MKRAGILFATVAIVFGQQTQPKKPSGSFDNSRATTPDALHSVGVRGSIDAGGYAASASAKTQTDMFRELADLQVAVLAPVLSAAGCSGESKVKRRMVNALSKKDFANAASEAEQALRQTENPEYRQIAGLAYEGLGRLESAADQLRKAANARKDEASYFAAGAALLLAGDMDGAAKLFKTSGERLSPLGAGAIQFQQGHFADAVRTFLAAGTKNKKGDEQAFQMLAVSLRAADAATIADAAKQLASWTLPGDSKTASAHLAYAVALSLTDGEPAFIRKELDSAVTLNPDLVLAHLQLGALLSARGDLEGAIQSYKRALILDDSLVDAHYRISQIYMRRGEEGNAQEQLRLHAQARSRQRTDIEAARVPVRVKETKLGECADTHQGKWR